MGEHLIGSINTVKKKITKKNLKIILKFLNNIGCYDFSSNGGFNNLYKEKIKQFNFKIETTKNMWFILNFISDFFCLIYNEKQDHVKNKETNSLKVDEYIISINDPFGKEENKINQEITKHDLEREKRYISEGKTIK